MKSTFIDETIPGKFIFNVLLQMQERSSQLLEKYKLVHRGWQRDIVCGDCNQDLGRINVRAKNWLSWSKNRFISDNIWTFCGSMFKTLKPLEWLEMHG